MSKPTHPSIPLHRQLTPSQSLDSQVCPECVQNSEPAEWSQGSRERGSLEAREPGTQLPYSSRQLPEGPCSGIVEMYETGARESRREPEMPCEARRSLAKPGAAKRGQEKPGEAKRVQGMPGEARRSQERPGKPKEARREAGGGQAQEGRPSFDRRVVQPLNSH